MKSNALKEVLYEYHQALIKSGGISDLITTDTTVICQNGTVRYCKLLISLVDPELSKLISDDKDDLCIIYPDLSKEEFIEDYSSFWKKASCDQVTPCDSKIHEEALIPLTSEGELLLGGLEEEDASHIQHSTDNEDNQSRQVQTFAEPVHLCDLCGVSFLTYDKLVKHRFNVHSDSSPKKIIPCPQCQKQFTSQTFLRKHKMTMHTVSQCKECMKVFKNLSSLRHHHRQEHRPDREKFECSICGKISLRRDTHERHLRIHNNKKTTFDCDICEMTFPLKHNLDRHKLSHHNDSGVLCPKCNRLFKRHDNMKRHLLRCKK